MATEYPTFTPPPQTPPPAYPYPPYGMPMPPPNEEDEISLYELWQVIWGGKWLILFSMLLAVGVAVVVALSQPNLYQAQVVLEPVKEEKGGGGLAALAGQFGGLASMAGIELGGGGSDHATNVLKTRLFMEQFIRDQQLKPLLFPKQWNESQQQWRVEKPGLFSSLLRSLGLEESAEKKRHARETLAAGEPSLEKSYQKLKEMVQVAEDKKSALITLTVESEDPQLAAQWANGLIDKLREVLREETLTKAQKNIAFLEQELVRTNLEESRQMLYSLMRNHIKNRTLASATDNFAFQVIDPAVVPEQKSKPKRSLIVVLGGILGGMLGVFVVFIRNAIRNRRREEQEKQRKTTLAVEY